MTIYGLDCSHFQPSLDLGRVFDLNPTICFAMVKMSEGTSWRDPRYPVYRSQFAATEGLFAAYHYLRGDSSIEGQAHNALQAVGDLDIPIFIDIERTNGSPQPTLAQVGLFHYWINTLGGRSGDLLYLPEWYWYEIGKPKTSDWALWQSSYGSNTGSYPGDGSDLWKYDNGQTVSVLQYTSKGRLKGYSGGLDLNAYRGTREELAATGWFKDYKKAVDVPLTADDLTAIQKAVAATPITVDGSGTTMPLQKVLRKILANQAPTADYAAVKAAVVDVLKTGVDGAAPPPVG